MTPYATIYDRALAKLTDYDLAQLPEKDLEDMLHSWLLSAIAKFRKCQSDLSLRDEENKRFTEDLLDVEIEVLALLVATEWLDSQIQSCLLTKQFLGGKEEKMFSQANHLETLMALRDSNRLEARKLMRDWTFRPDHSYFE